MAKSRKPKIPKCALCGENCTEIYREPDVRNLHILCFSDPRGQMELRKGIKKAGETQPTTSIYT